MTSLLVSGRLGRRRRPSCSGLFPTEQSPHFRLAEPPVPPWSPDAADAPRCCPPGNRLRVYSEEGCHLPGREQALIVTFHVPPLLSPFRSMSSVSRKHPFTS